MNDLVRLFYEPRAVFLETKEQGAWLLITLALLLLVSLTSVTTSIASYVHVDLDRANEETLQQMAEQNISPEAIEQLRQEIAKSGQSGSVFLFSLPVVVGLSVLMATTGLIFVLLIHALYFKMVGSMLKLEYRYKHWLCFVAMARLPAFLVVFVVALLAVLVMGTQPDRLSYAVLSFAWWLPLPNESHMLLSGLVNGLNIAVIWTVVLLAIGFRAWTGRSLGVAVAVVGVPYVLLYGFVLLI